MERSKLVVGAKYAVTRNRDSLRAEQKTLLSADLHTWTRGEKRELIPAKPGSKAALGSFYKSEVGLLMEDAKGDKEIVYPAHVKMTWEDFETHRARQLEATAREQVRREEQAQRNSEMADELRALWPAEVQAPHFSPWGTRVDITKAQLIELIKFLQKD